MAKEQKRFKKRIDILSQNIQTLEATGVDHNFLELSKTYQCDRNRIHKEILRKYVNLFAIIGNVRELCILGIQHVDLLVQENEVDFGKCIKRYQALKPMMIKYRDILDEIICLIENGYTDGAMQRWRSYFEYSVIIMFILQQGEEVADEYINNWFKSIEDELRPRTNLAWAKAADCLKEEKQISIKMLFKNIRGIDPKFAGMSLHLYKWICQLIHGSSLGSSLSFNDEISFEINDSHEKNADYYIGGISTVISNTMCFLFLTYRMYLNTFPSGSLNIESLWKPLEKEYVKVFYDYKL